MEAKVKRHAMSVCFLPLAFLTLETKQVMLSASRFFNKLEKSNAVEMSLCIGLVDTDKENAIKQLLSRLTCS